MQLSLTFTPEQLVALDQVAVLLREHPELFARAVRRALLGARSDGAAGDERPLVVARRLLRAPGRP